ncbi:MAG: hypothetical protein Q9219_001882 [cf. Caloplaca sp. 3 TL-2023]
MSDHGGGISLPPSSSLSTPSPIPSSFTNPITLRVGEKLFYTRPETLSGSTFLTAMLSNRWDQRRSQQQPDGSYFVDADPQIFEHVLRFLRSGIYPVCYEAGQGHDWSSYANIRSQADYLGVEQLVEWLDAKKYLQAIKIETSARVVEYDEETTGLGGSHASDERVQYHPGWRTVKKYVCPRGISVHYGEPKKCGRACAAALGDAEPQYEEVPVLSTLVVTEKVVFDEKVCVEDLGGEVSTVL